MEGSQKITNKFCNSVISIQVIMLKISPKSSPSPGKSKRTPDISDGAAGPIHPSLSRTKLTLSSSLKLIVPNSRRRRDLLGVSRSRLGKTINLLQFIYMDLVEELVGLLDYFGKDKL
jgi:hypothetical protein